MQAGREAWKNSRGDILQTNNRATESLSSGQEAARLARKKRAVVLQTSPIVHFHARQKGYGYVSKQGSKKMRALYGISLNQP